MTAWARRIVPLALVLMAVTGCRRSRMPPRGTGDPVVVTTADDSGESGITFAAEVEPNDDRARATVLVLGGDPLVAAVSGALPVGARDADLFRIIVPGPDVVVAVPPSGSPAQPPLPDAGPPQGRRLIIALTPSATLGAALQLQDAAGQPLCTSTAGPGERHGVPNATAAPGATYYVRIKSDDGPTGAFPRGAAVGERSYRLVVRLRDFELGDEREPNDRAALATLLGSADSSPEAAGFFGWRKDEDWFRLPLPPAPMAGALELELDGVEGVTASLAVLDSAERRIATARGRRGERVALHNVVVPPDATPLGAAAGAPPAAVPRSCLVVVRTEAGRNLDQRYALRVRSEAIKDDTETEPNDDMPHARLVGDGTVSGYLPPGDVDLFRYDATAPTELRVDAEAPERVDLRIEILSGDGAVVARADSGRRHEAEHVANLYVAAGSLFIRVAAAKGEGNVDEPYRLKLSGRTPEPGDEREPNNGVPAATALPPGMVGTGFLYPRGDVDVWQLDVSPGATEPLFVTAGGIPGLAFEVRVAGRKSGKEFGRFTVTPAGVKKEVPAVPPGDTCCLLLAREPAGKGASIKDPYTVVVGP